MSWAKVSLPVIIAILFGILVKFPQPQLDTSLIESLAFNYTRPGDFYDGQEKISTTLPLLGVRICITGATSGIGKNLAVFTHGLGATVIAIGRSSSKLSRLQNELEQNSDDVKESRLITILADLGDLESVASAVDAISTKFTSLDILVNNAGMTYLGQTPESYSSAQGYDYTFAVNYLSHFLLTKKLIPLLEKSTYNPRIVQVSSSYHWQVDASDLVPTTNNEHPMASRNDADSYLHWKAYANSKLAQILHARALSRRLKKRESPVRVISICPGWVATDIARDDASKKVLDLLAFPANGAGLSSVLNAMLRPNVGLDETNDFIMNSKHRFMFNAVREFNFIKKNPLLRDAYLHMAAYFYFPFAQKFFFEQLVISASSPESYDVSAQESLYEWSMAAVLHWL